MEKIPHPADAGYLPLTMSVHESPLLEHDYAVWLSIYSSGTHSSICRYGLSTSDGHLKVHLQSQIKVTGLGCAVQGEISFSGHTQLFDYVRDRTQRLISLEELEESVKDDGGSGDVVELEDAGDHVHITAYSGALAYSTYKVVVVNYYQ